MLFVMLLLIGNSGVTADSVEISDNEIQTILSSGSADEKLMLFRRVGSIGFENLSAVASDYVLSTFDTNSGDEIWEYYLSFAIRKSVSNPSFVRNRIDPADLLLGVQKGSYRIAEGSALLLAKYYSDDDDFEEIVVSRIAKSTSESRLVERLLLFVTSFAPLEEESLVVVKQISRGGEASTRLAAIKVLVKTGQASLATTTSAMEIAKSDKFFADSFILLQLGIGLPATEQQVEDVMGIQRVFSQEASKPLLERSVAIYNVGYTDALLKETLDRLNDMF